MTRKTSGDSGKGVSHDIFWRIHQSFTTQGQLTVSWPDRPDSLRIGLPSPTREVHLSSLSTLHGVVFAIFW
jgi:hypothetical protein